MTTMSPFDIEELVKRLRLCTIDYNEKPIPDEAEPLLSQCRDLRDAADLIEALQSQIASLQNQ